MASTIVTKNSSTASAVPLTGDLTQGELAVNVTDKRLFTKNSGGTVVELGTNPASLALPNGTANGVAYLNGSKVLTTGSALTFDGATLIQKGAVSTSSVIKLFNNNQSTSGFWLGQGWSSGTDNVAYLLNTANADFVFATNNAEQMRLTSTGLGIGTSSPQIQSWRTGTYLTVANASTRGQVEIDGAVADSGSASLGALIFTYSTNTTNHKDVALIEATSSGSTANQRGGVLNFYTKANGTASPALNMTLDASGGLMVGTTTNYCGGTGINAVCATSNTNALYARATNASFGVDVFLVGADRNTTTNSYYPISYYNYGASAYRFRVADSGNVTNTNNSYGGISDVKLKENITDATPKLDGLMKVRVVNYNLKTDPDHKQLGVIAQELEQIFPGMVEKTSDRDAEGNDLGTTTKNVKYSVFVPMLIKAIQEQQALITQLTERITALEGK